MLRELINFTDSLDPEFKALGMKNKEGLHIFLEIHNDGERHWIDEKMEVVFTRKKELTPDDNALIKYSSTLTQLSWCVNTNKCFDLPIKAIHSCSPYCLALKRENLVGGEKYANNASGKKSQVYERINAYFGKASELLESEEEKQYIEIFKNALNTEERFQFWVENSGYWSELKDSDYVIFYLKEPIEKYQATNKKYLADKLFNKSEYNVEVKESVFGTSDFFNTFSTSKAFLMHQSASFDISGRISASDAKSLYEFHDIIGRSILPNPLPIFLHREELKRVDKKTLLGESISLFKKEAINGVRIKYHEIINTLYNDFEDDFGNYYLLFYNYRDEKNFIKDFDFVSKFEYRLTDGDDDSWKIYNLMEIKNSSKTLIGTLSIKNVFELQNKVFSKVFYKTKRNDSKKSRISIIHPYGYFEEGKDILKKGEEIREFTKLSFIKNRKAIYDFIYKSKKQAFTKSMFDTIMLGEILESIRLDKFENNKNTEEFNIREKLNIWFSFYEKFHLSQNQSKDMNNQITDLKLFIKGLAEGQTNITSDEEFGFALGQLIRYINRLHESSDRSFSRVKNTYMSKRTVQDYKKVLANDTSMYMYKIRDSAKYPKFDNLISQVMLAQPKKNMDELIPFILGGMFSPNILLTRAEIEAEPSEEIEEISSEDKNDEE